MRIARTLILSAITSIPAMGCRVEHSPQGYCEKVMDTVCAAQTEDDCLRFAGCNLKGGCVETGCETFTEPAACQGQGAKCHWTGKTCRPLKIQDCGKHMEVAECVNDKGCLWSTGCGGPLLFCEQMEDESACHLSAQCHWAAATE
ncbi:MAG TPA: hypothetical protein VIV60_26460 [Polyangiaceae bacterium]